MIVYEVLLLFATRLLNGNGGELRKQIECPLSMSVCGNLACERLTLDHLNRYRMVTLVNIQGELRNGAIINCLLGQAP